MKWIFLFLTFIILGFSCTRVNKTDKITIRIKRIDMMTEQIHTKLKEAFDKFESSNNGFIISFFHKDTAILQIVHRSFSEKTRKPNDEFGFALNLTFDPTFSKETELYKEFSNMDISKFFTFYEWNGIPCYIKDFNRDIDKLAAETSHILTDLYGLKNDGEFEIELMDQGTIK